MLRTILVTLVFVCPFALAQDRAVELLEGARTPFIPQDIETVEVRGEKITHTGKEVKKIETHHLFDAEKRLLYAEATTDIGPLKVWMTPRGNLTTMNGKPSPIDMSSLVASLSQDGVPNIVAAAEVVPEDYEVISYDGMKSYGGLVSGEQVTLSYEAPITGDTITKFLFGQQGELLGSVTNTLSYGETLVLYDVSGSQNYLRRGLIAYTLNGETPHLAEERYHEYLFNRPIDPSYFEIP